PRWAPIWTGGSRRRPEILRRCRTRRARGRVPPRSCAGWRGARSRSSSATTRSGGTCSSESIDGVVAWIEAHRVAVVWGDPICAAGDERLLVAELARHARGERLQTCMLLVSEPAARAAIDDGFV